MATRKLLDKLRCGDVTLRELRGISAEEMGAGVSAARKLMEEGEHQSAAEVLSGLALYDPFYPEVWRGLEELFRRQSCPQVANLFSEITRIMVT
jgi:hypothetical protein